MERCGARVHALEIPWGGVFTRDQIAASLGAQKARAAIATGADVVATGNIGCLVQLRMHLARLGSPLRVRHTMQVLRDAG